MAELDTKLEITNFLNNNGYDEVEISSPGDTFGYDFKVRVGYHEHISATLIEEMELAFNVRVEEFELWDEDCGDLYGYGVDVVDPDTGYTVSELNDLESNYNDEAEFLSKYGTDNEWGVA